MSRIAFYTLWLSLGFGAAIMQRFYPARGPAQPLGPVEWTFTIGFGPVSAAMYILEKKISMPSTQSENMSKKSGEIDK